jgi:ATP-binding cassette subfamily F protein 3
MTLIRFHDVSMRYDAAVILRRVHFRLRAGERVGLIGKNGTGKTTLLKLVLGQAEPSEGRVELAPNLKIGYFSQFSDLDGTPAVQAVLEALFADVRVLEDELAHIPTLLKQTTSDVEHTRLLERQAAIIDQITARDGWDYQRHIDTALTKLGFNATRRAQPINELSGGWRNRAAPAKCLLLPAQRRRTPDRSSGSAALISPISTGCCRSLI